MQSPLGDHRKRTTRPAKLNRIGRTSQLPDTPAVRGMINRVKHLVQVVYLQIDIRHFAEQDRREYKRTITERITRVQILWDQFEAAVEACLADPEQDDRRLTECVNEIAVGAELARDKALDGKKNRI